ncbi:hypothetical protein L218DRAFT_843403, partial [Marasmius fiardii PR-910]
PVYLFVLPLSIDILSIALQKKHTTSLHMWSFDKMGRSCISDSICQLLGLPTELYIDYKEEQDLYAEEFSYPAEVYKRLHSWQVARGFDPTTTEFAKHCGLHQFTF